MKILGNKLYLSLIGIILVLVFAVAYVFAAVLDQPLTSRPVEVKVELAQTGGLFEGSAVTYRGIKVGKVRSIVPDAETGVVATIAVTSGTEIPKDSIAKVRSLSPVGEQYLDFQPKKDGGPFLASGDVVPAESTDLPKSLSSTVVAVNNVLRQIDDKKLRTVLSELSTGLKGTGDDLGQILDQGTAILETLDAVWPETDRVISSSGTVLGIATDNADSLRQLARSSKQFAQFLREYDPELRRMLKRGPGQINELVKLIKDANEVLPGFLATGVSFTDVFRSYEPHLRALLQNYGPGLRSVLAKVKGGELRIQIITKSDPRCNYGTSRLDPRVNERRALQKDGRCSASFATLQRGAANAPGPVR
ncbi:phospholipid/cholesterol/gamma-HCH transport system substrate-binding protein [Nocardioides aromaticivorans]|uniref:Phospholipid/cholesterol/gamma-HCH transport system substrate-binding protein n=1 Tax=Nocardioides aromaticivorans TaxID=200618 RepID=A0A7Z0CN81_9ACTN|nr:MlaD family protein [Nocardioides aromaticivorans]NYI47114.1 phospholipid/cholesterol/gamma-HCH transport system substrate-binding protein [Nocardioides aromaticivorans]